MNTAMCWLLQWQCKKTHSSRLTPDVVDAGYRRHLISINSSGSARHMMNFALR
jgi:hypothetical protein